MKFPVGRSIGKKLSGTAVYLYYTARRPSVSPDCTRSVFLDLTSFPYARYFYSFVKFLNLEGCSVKLKLRMEILHTLNHAEYGNRVLQEKLIQLGKSEGEEVQISDSGGSGKQLLPWDFQCPPRGPASERAYVIPMSQHPMMYSTGNWNAPLPAGPPRLSMLFIGNNDGVLYSGLSKGGLFNLLDRPTLLEAVRHSGRHRKATSLPDLDQAGDGRIITIDTGDFSIAPELFRQVMARHAFFLCAPGVFMPLCHNLVEAMSAGAIPFIERSYADLLCPPLEHLKNAMIFSGAEDLPVRIEEAFSMDPDEIAKMKQGVLDYYNEFLTPAAVVTSILRPETKTLYMLAGKTSLDLRRRLAPAPTEQTLL